MAERSQLLGEFVVHGSCVEDWLFDVDVSVLPDTGEFSEESVQTLQAEFDELVISIENRRGAHDQMLVQARDLDFLESGSVRDSLSGMSTASNGTQFAASRELLDAEHAQAEERARLEAYR